MTRNLERIEYRKGMLKRGMKPDDLPIRIWKGATIQDEIYKAIHEEGILDLGGVYGARDAGDPVEYDYLKVITDNSTVEIEFFNRGIALFMINDERFRRIHRVLCKLDMAG